MSCAEQAALPHCSHDGSTFEATAGGKGEEEAPRLAVCDTHCRVSGRKGRLAAAAGRLLALLGFGHSRRTVGVQG